MDTGGDMGSKGGAIDTEAIRKGVDLVGQGADMMAYAVERIPRRVDAGMMSGLIRDQVETVAANLVALIVDLDDMYAKGAFAADQYKATQQSSIDEIKHIMPDEPPGAYYKSRHGSGD